MVGVEVGDEDLLELDQPDRAHQLALRPLAAVEQQAVAAAAHERGRQAAAGAGSGAGGADEEHVEVHCTPYVDWPAPLELDQLESHRRALDPCEAHRVRRRPAPLGRAAGIEELKAVLGPLVERQVRVSEHDRVRAVAVATAHALEPPGGRPGVVHDREPRPLGLDHPLGGQQPTQLVGVHVPAHADQRRPDPLERPHHLRRHEVAGVQEQVGVADQLDAPLRQAPTAPGHVGVRDDGDQHARSATQTAASATASTFAT